MVMSTKNGVQSDQQTAIIKPFQLKCPTCKETVVANIPLNIKDLGQGGLVNVLIPDTATPCHHAIQIFLDQNYKVRGYTRIDYVNYVGSGEAGAERAPAPEEGFTSSAFLKNAERDESELTPAELELKERISAIFRDFTTLVPEVKAIACFDYQGDIIAKALTEDIRIENVSMAAAAMLSQSNSLMNGLKMTEMNDFTISGENDKVSVQRCDELLLLILYSKKIKEGLMKLNLKRLDTDVRAAADQYMASMAQSLLEHL
jgi:hypothetical protein